MQEGCGAVKKTEKEERIKWTNARKPQRQYEIGKMYCLHRKE